ncbi:hypothetical protein [Priestia megaterium]|uniref:hypothetical protein n=1 Tax=Priestia megaterium TaxID=1404 RepID=UPI0030091A4F
MQFFKNRIIQTVLFACGATLMFSMIGYTMFVQAFPKDVEEEARIKQFKPGWDKQAEYYRKHPHEINEQ